MLIRSDSTEYIKASVSVDHDITGRPIDVALPYTDSPPTTWYRATVASTSYNAGTWTVIYRLLIGPGNGADLSLGPGNYDWIVRVIDNPETLIRRCGELQVRAA